MQRTDGKHSQVHSARAIEMCHPELIPNWLWSRDRSVRSGPHLGMSGQFASGARCTLNLRRGARLL